MSDLRRGLRLTQAELAEKVHVDVATVSRLERGKTIPPVLKLAEIAAALDVQIVDLFMGDPIDLDDAYDEVMDRLNAKTRTMIRGLLRAIEARQGWRGWRHGWS